LYENSHVCEHDDFRELLGLRKAERIPVVRLSGWAA
jgi:hypothetical protein